MILDGLRELSQRRGVRESTGEVILDVFGVGINAALETELSNALLMFQLDV